MVQTVLLYDIKINNSGIIKITGSFNEAFHSEFSDRQCLLVANAS